MKRSGLPRRQSSTPHYQTFPNSAPPKSRGRPPPSSHQPSFIRASSSGHASPALEQDSPLPKAQLAILAVIALAEQTALNSISPYLPEMTASFPEVDAEQIGLYVGTIASSFALAQLGTNYFWGCMSDRVGRKPVVMLGTLLTAACFVAFGFCKTLWQAIVVQLLMGLVNGNQGVISTCLGEITDRSNQSRAFTYLPVIYGLGAITGPAVGGLLVREGGKYPYLLPNLFAAAILLVDLVLTGFFLEESLEEAKDLPPLNKRVGTLFAWLWQFTGGSRHPTYLRVPFAQRSHLSDIADEDLEDNDTSSLLSAGDVFGHSQNNATLSYKEVLNRNTVLLLTTYLVFQFSNISFNTLYPIFASSPPHAGRGLSPNEIGLSLSFAGIITILFQIFVFGPIKAKMGNKSTYRSGLFLFFLAMIAMPWTGYKTSPPLFGWFTGTTWLWIEIGTVLLVKTVASVGGLTAALLLITNSAPNHNVLGRLNGLAQTLSAAGRAAGPFLSGGLFSLGTRMEGHGDVLAWSVFGGVAAVGWVASWGIKGGNLESDDCYFQDEDEEDEDYESDLEDGTAPEHSHRNVSGSSAGIEAV